MTGTGHLLAIRDDKGPRRVAWFSPSRKELIPWVIDENTGKPTAADDYAKQYGDGEWWVLHEDDQGDWTKTLLVMPG